MPHNMLLSRIRAEYLEMPGLRLTLDQAQRLCGVVAEKFLHVTSNGAFARLTEGAIPRRRPVNADLGTEQRVTRAS